MARNSKQAGGAEGSLVCQGSLVSWDCLEKCLNRVSLLKQDSVHRPGPEALLPLQAFSSLAEAAYEATEAAEDQEEPSTYCLSSSFEIIVQKLLETTDR